MGLSIVTSFTYLNMWMRKEDPEMSLSFSAFPGCGLFICSHVLNGSWVIWFLLFSVWLGLPIISHLKMGIKQKSSVLMCMRLDPFPIICVCLYYFKQQIPWLIRMQTRSAGFCWCGFSKFKLLFLVSCLGDLNLIIGHLGGGIYRIL